MSRLALPLLLVMALSGPALADSKPSREIYVSPAGSDANPGTKDAPLATLSAAQKAVRKEIAAGLKRDVSVLIQGGVYRLTEPLVFGPEDSGTEKHCITYRRAGEQPVVLSGGEPIGGWKQGEGGIWTATVPGAKDGKWKFRNVYVDGRRAVRARTPNFDAQEPHWQLKDATLSADRKRYTLTLPAGLLPEWKKPAEIEVMVAGNWEISRLRVQSIDAKSGLVVLSPPHAQGHEAICPGPGRWCCFEGAREMLDQPGEWHLDQAAGVLSYLPLPGQDMTKAEVIAPRAKRLIEVKGTASRPVQNLHFRGIAFEHTDWELPAIGYLGIQACHYVSGEHWSKPWDSIPAAIHLEYARRCSVEDGRLAHLGGCGIELEKGCRENLFQGNDLFDISGNGVMLGGPNDEQQVPAGNRVANNHVHACGVEFYGAVGIWNGFTRGTAIAHNLVHGLPYSGISVGWQWNPQPTACKENTVEFNHIYDVMNRLCDGGGIYTLGLQPGTVIRGNHIHDVRRSRYAQGAPNNGMFIDEGSKGFLFEKNVIYQTAAEHVRFNQCSRDWHTWRDNHFGEPAAVKASGKPIIDQAGLEPAWRKRLGATE